MGLTISPSDRIFLDTNIYIFALEDDGKRGIRSRKILAQIKQKAPIAYTSVVTVSEILVEVFRKNLIDKATEYLEFISAGGLITVIEIDRRIAVDSARIRAQSNKKIKTPDALQIACAISSKCNKLLTFDTGMPKCVDDLEIVRLQ